MLTSREQAAGPDADNRPYRVLVCVMTTDPIYYVERRLEPVHGYRATEIYLLRVDGGAAGTMQLIGDVDALGVMKQGKRYRIPVEEVSDDSGLPV